ITASGGTLNVLGTLTGGSSLSMADVANSVLKASGASSTSNAITLDTTNKTLEIGTGAAALTITGAQTVAGGHILLDGGTLTDSSGITVSFVSLRGQAFATPAPYASLFRSITASGGTLAVLGNL